MSVSNSKDDSAFVAYAGRTRDVELLAQPERDRLQHYIAWNYGRLRELSPQVLVIVRTVKVSGWFGGLLLGSSRSFEAGASVNVPGLPSFGVSASTSSSSTSSSITTDSLQVGTRTLTL